MLNPTLATDPNLISYHHETLQGIMPQLDFVSDMWIGKRAWFDDNRFVVMGNQVQWGRTEEQKSFKYLPRAAAEEPLDHVERLQLSRFDRYFRNAIEKDFASLLSRFSVDDAHPSIDESLPNFDRQGNSIYTFAHDWIAYALRDGMAGVLVDYPRVEPGTRRDQIAGLGLRPYPVLYKRENIINWDYFYAPSGEIILTELVLVDYVRVAEGTYGSTVETRYKRLWLEDGRQWCEIKRVETDGKGGQPQEVTVEPPFMTGAESITFVPLALSINPFEAEIPLEDIANLNLSHYRKQTDMDVFLHLCSGPTLNVNDLNPAATSRDAPVVKVGPRAVLRNVEAKWIGVDPSSLESLRLDVAAVEEKIKALTLAFFSGNASPTATQVLIESTQTQANILGMAEFIESAFQTLFTFWVGYIDPSYSGDIGTVSLEQVLGLVRLAMTGDIKDVFEAILNGILSQELGLKLLKMRGFFGSDFSEDDLQAELRMRRVGIAQSDPVDEPLGV
jgi:hypothetical protein